MTEVMHTQGGATDLFDSLLPLHRSLPILESQARAHRRGDRRSPGHRLCKRSVRIETMRCGNGIERRPALDFGLP
jgi:hypothetical protein